MGPLDYMSPGWRVATLTYLGLMLFGAGLGVYVFAQSLREGSSNG